MTLKKQYSSLKHNLESKQPIEACHAVSMVSIEGIEFEYSTAEKETVKKAEFF
jgi:hypothetical protein